VTDAAGGKRTVPSAIRVSHHTSGAPNPTQEQQMAARELQRLADASENDAAQRYMRSQVLASVVADAIRRADAMSRLDASLRLAMMRRVA
jgi:hypothetical protein